MREVSGFVIRTMTGFDRSKTNVYDILKYHPHSIGAIYQIELFLRDLVNSQT